MIITGRLTGDAQVAELSDERKVVNFSIAINDRFKTKGGEQKEVTTYISCAYWLNAGVAKWLNKGKLVELFGRIGVDAYINTNGDAVGRLTFHVNNVKILGRGRLNGQVSQPVTVQEEAGKEDKEDLPF